MAITVELFEHPFFQGEHISLSSSDNSLLLNDHMEQKTGTSWNDQVSSINISGSSTYGDTPSFYENLYLNQNDPGEDWKYNNFDDNSISSVTVPYGFEVTLYEYANGKGDKLILETGDPDLTDNFIRENWNDKVSSVKVSGGTVRFWEDTEFGGQYIDLSSDTTSLFPFWDNRISSVEFL